MSVAIKITATVFPAIALVLGFLMLVAGINAGWIFVFIGVFGQAGWLLMKGGAIPQIY